MWVYYIYLIYLLFIKTFVFERYVMHSLSVCYKIGNESLISFDDIDNKEYESIDKEEEKKVDKNIMKMIIYQLNGA